MNRFQSVSLGICIFIIWCVFILPEINYLDVVNPNLMVAISGVFGLSLGVFMISASD